MLLPTRNNVSQSRFKKTWRHPQNQKCITYSNTTRGRLSHGIKSACTKFDKVWTCSIRYMLAYRQTDRHTHYVRYTLRTMAISSNADNDRIYTSVRTEVAAKPPSHHHRHSVWPSCWGSSKSVYTRHYPGRDVRLAITTAVDCCNSRFLTNSASVTRTMIRYIELRRQSTFCLQLHQIFVLQDIVVVSQTYRQRSKNISDLNLVQLCSAFTHFMVDIFLQLFSWSIHRFQTFQLLFRWLFILYVRNTGSTVVPMRQHLIAHLHRIQWPENGSGHPVICISMIFKRKLISYETSGGQIKILTCRENIGVETHCTPHRE